MSTISSLVLRKPVVLTKPQQAIRLLRDLYRETSCLFDEVARKRIKARIRDRFRKCQDVEDEQRQTKLLKDGRRILSTLTRANRGDKWRMAYVLQQTYGAKGKRKHELLEPLLKAVNPSEPLIPNRPRTAPPGRSDAILALFKAQTGKMIKIPEPVIPEEAVSGKPFPKVRIANIKWRHRSMNLKKITPPLPPSEFERLELLVMGFWQCGAPKRQYITRETKIGPKKQRANVYNPRQQRRIFEFTLEQFTLLEHRDTPRGAKWVARYSPVLQALLRAEGDPEDFEDVNTVGEPYGVVVNPNRTAGRSAAERKKAKNKSADFSTWLEKKKEEGKVPPHMTRLWG
ncbi:hypothetical protein TWF694_011807 [Orbilia ellipsospora]|uniref:LYR motif-containing protein Cup1-like N-terminal domain-containing protein n=1 Tax=Orbilia ellipsospora TaxID=2528407 RepID=A0AAV9XCJ3_9PEZI